MPSELSTELVWQGEMAFNATTGTAHELVLDASADHGGKDAGPRPMELLLVGLAGCTAMDVISMLTKMRQPVESYQVRVHGTRRDDNPQVYTDITVEHIVTGDVKQDRLEHAVELSNTTYCSAQAMLRQVANITVTARVVREGE